MFHMQGHRFYEAVNKFARSSLLRTRISSDFIIETNVKKVWKVYSMGSSVNVSISSDDNSFLGTHKCY